MPSLAQAAKLELLVAAKWRERAAIPSIYAPRLPMCPKYNVATCVEEFGEHQVILEEQTSFEEGQSAKPCPGSQIGAVGHCEVEGKAIHSFNIRPKAPHGSQIQCCNMRRRIGEHQIILEEQTSLEEGQ